LILCVTADAIGKATEEFVEVLSVNDALPLLRERHPGPAKIQDGLTLTLSLVLPRRRWKCEVETPSGRRTRDRASISGRIDIEGSVAEIKQELFGSAGDFDEYRFPDSDRAGLATEKRTLSERWWKWF